MAILKRDDKFTAMATRPQEVALSSKCVQLFCWVLKAIVT